MSKSFRMRNQVENQWVPLAEIFIPDSTREKIMRRDAEQVEKYRLQYEAGSPVVRVVLRPRFGGGYNVEDGRHRVIAAKLARVGFIEAKVVG